MQVSRFISACEKILRVPAPAFCVARTLLSAKARGECNSRGQECPRNVPPLLLQAALGKFIP